MLRSNIHLVHNVWSGSKSVVMFGLINIMHQVYIGSEHNLLLGCCSPFELFFWALLLISPFKLFFWVLLLSSSFDLFLLSLPLALLLSSPIELSFWALLLSSPFELSFQLMRSSKKFLTICLICWFYVLSLCSCVFWYTLVTNDLTHGDLDLANFSQTKKMCNSRTGVNDNKSPMLHWTHRLRNLKIWKTCSLFYGTGPMQCVKHATHHDESF